MAAAGTVGWRVPALYMVDYYCTQNKSGVVFEAVKGFLD